MHTDYHCEKCGHKGHDVGPAPITSIYDYLCALCHRKENEQRQRDAR